jgi:hypothetical protein
MKRSDAIKKLFPKVICHHDVISIDMQQIYESRAKSLLDFIENELVMLPPDSEAEIEYYGLYGDDPYTKIVKKWEPE